MLLFIYYNVVVNRCSLTLFETLLKRTETYTKKDFPQLSPTLLGAKVVNTNLVPRYLTVAAAQASLSGSYSPFLCWSHFNLISWKLKLQHVFHTFRNLLLKEVKKKYFFNENTTNDEMFLFLLNYQLGCKDIALKYSKYTFFQWKVTFVRVQQWQLARQYWIFTSIF